MNKITAMIIGIILIVLGGLALVPSLALATMWLAIVLLILGIFIVVMGIMKKNA